MKNTLSKFTAMSETEKRLYNYKVKNKMRSAFMTVFRMLMIVSIGYIVIYPLLYMVVTSLRSRASYSDPGIVWILKTYEWTNYSDAFGAMKYPKALLNTLVINMLSAGLEIVSCSLVAYGLSRFNYKIKKVQMVVLLLSIVIPTQMIVIPQMINFSQLDFLGILKLVGNIAGKELRINILDTPFTFYLPSLFGVGLKSGIMIFIYIQFFKGLPKELEEAAAIDGAGAFKTFLSIAVPSSGVVFLTVSIFSVVWHWNDYYLSAMFMTNSKSLALTLATLKEQMPTLGFGYSIVNDKGGSILMAACVLFILPMLVFYICLQGKFVKSIDRVGITG